jgi:hypothetical protein
MVGALKAKMARGQISVNGYVAALVFCGCDL